MLRPFLLAAVLSPVVALAQTGLNSSCATAMELEVSPTNVQTSLIPVYYAWFGTAVPDPATTCSGSTACITSWYRFTATATSHWVRTDGQGTDDASMEVFSGSCGSLTSIGCFSANSATPALTGLSVGSSYTLRVRMSNCGPNLCQVWIGVVSAPSNNECAGAIELPVTSGAIQAWPATEISSLGATQSQTACTGNAAASNDDVWYRFTATANTHFLPNTRLSTAVQDNVFQWFSGTCGNLTSIGCDVDFKTGLSPGTQYYIRAYHESTGAETMRAVADVYAPALNDECTGALPLEVTLVGGVPKPVNISTILTSSSTVPCYTEQHDAWLSFTAPGTSVIVVADDGNPSAALYSGSCGALVCVAEDNASPQVEFTGLTPGNTYYLKIGETSLGRKNITLWAFAPVTNDDCTTAMPIAVQNDPEVFTHGHQFNTSQRAWYTFTATATRHVVEGFLTATENGIAASVAVHSGACGNLTQLAAGGISVPLVVSGLTVGQQYYLEMESVWASAFRVAVRDVLLNDACEGAIELPFSGLQDHSSLPRGTNALASDGTGGCLPTKDVWYRFTAAHTSAGFMAVNGDQGFLDTSIELFQGTCGSLISLGCTNDAPRAIFNGLVPGTEYHIRWSRASIGLHTPMLFDQPVNDDVAGALPAPWGSTFAQAAEQYDTFGATESMPTHCPGWGPDDDMWFTFTASATTHSVQAQQGNNSFYEPSLFPYSAFQAQVYDTLTSDPAVLAANLVGCGFSPVALTGLTVGKQYLYRVFQAESGPTRRCGFSTSVSNANNDEAAGAHTLVYADDYTAYFNTTGATQSLPGADCQVDDTADDDIWFKFTAAAGAARIAIGYATADVTIEFFSGAPGNLLSIACDGNILELSALTSGQTYYARVYSWGNAVPVEGRIGLFLTPSLTANGCVDENCLGPVLLNNPGIEQGEQCFAHVADVGAIAGQGGLLAPGWPRMQGGSSDAFGSCSLYGERREVPGPIGNYQNAPLVLSRSGKGMGGLLMANGQPFAYVEYLQAQLAEPLVPGEPYLVSFYAAIDPTYNICLSGLGAALSEGPLVWGYQNGPLTAQPAAVSLDAICTMQWTNVCAVYVPTSPVDHITIGAFQRTGEPRRIGPSTGDSYYAIDDVVVSRMNDPNCITSIGDVPQLDEEANGSGDDLRVYPNPANELLNIVADPSLFGQRAVIEVFDATGSRVYTEQVTNFSALQPLDLSQDWKEGLYLVMVRVEGRAPKAARVVVKR